jgi:hypothetical protein
MAGMSREAFASFGSTRDRERRTSDTTSADKMAIERLASVRTTEPTPAIREAVCAFSVAEWLDSVRTVEGRRWRATALVLEEVRDALVPSKRFGLGGVRVARTRIRL